MDKNVVLKNIKQHNPTSPLLIGELSPEDKVVLAKQQSWRVRQTSIF
jgi:hypothetical protein